MAIRLVTWNINSVRLRAPLLERLIAEQAPDVICLQETKCPDEKFPETAFRKLGYAHIAKAGQAGYHGVATLSKLPFEDVSARDFCARGDTRHIAVTLAGGLRLHNFYVPAGGDEPDRAVNVKFGHKLDFLTEMADWFADWAGVENMEAIVVGDLNVAPLENDVWSHKQLLKVVSHTPIEVDHLKRAQTTGRWVDVMREFVAADQKLYTWWSYRARDWRAANRGRRLDHIWTSPALAGACRHCDVMVDARGWERPSDHAPVILDLDR